MASIFFQSSKEFTSEIPTEVVANAMISKFEALIDELYKNGMKRFLLDCVHINLETFYSHVLCWYLPSIIKEVAPSINLDQASSQWRTLKS